MPRYIDAHSHLNFLDYQSDFDAVVERMRTAEVSTITVGTDYNSSLMACEISKNIPESFASVGLHPTDTHKEDFDASKFEELVRRPNVVAVGECGLDYFRARGDLETAKKVQRDAFERQIELALKHGKPLMIHCRDAYDDIIDILAAYKSRLGDKVRGNIHFYAGDLGAARKFIDLDFTLSFTGVLTFARTYDEVVRSIPLSSILSETDAPFVAPASHRGKRNEPSYVVEIVKAIATIRGEPLETVEKALVENAERVFGLKRA